MMEMRRSACFSINLEQAWVGMKWIAGLVNDEQLADWWLKLTWNFHGLETGCLQPQQGTAYCITYVCVCGKLTLKVWTKSAHSVANPLLKRRG